MKSSGQATVTKVDYDKHIIPSCCQAALLPVTGLAFLAAHGVPGGIAGS